MEVSGCSAQLHLKGPSTGNPGTAGTAGLCEKAEERHGRLLHFT